MKKYSQFINFNIYLWTSKTEEVEEPGEEDAAEDKKAETADEDKKEEEKEEGKEDEKKEEDKEKEDKDDEAEVEEESEEKEKKPKTKKVCIVPHTLVCVIGECSVYNKCKLKPLLSKTALWFWENLIHVQLWEVFIVPWPHHWLEMSALY